MNYSSLLGSKLKSQPIIDLLELDDFDVTYHFDRLSEGSPDQYYATSEDSALELLFNDEQVLTSIFIDSTSLHFSDEGLSNLTIFDTKAAVRSYAKTNNIVFQEDCVEFLGSIQDWIKCEENGYTVHYTFDSLGNLTKITLSILMISQTNG